MARFELYPKLVITVETTLEKKDALKKLDAYFSDAQKKIRQLLNDNSTTIISWHIHYSDGSRDEPEPGG